MAKGPIITHGMRKKIAILYLEDTQQSAKEIHCKLKELYGDQSPGLSAIQKELRRIRRKPNVICELDKPWVIGAIGKYNIPSELVPTIIELLQNRNNQGEIVGRSYLTIRQVLWVARLLPLMDSIMEDVLALYPPNDDVDKAKSLHYMLVQMASAYARCEQIAELNNEAPPGEKVLFDTQALDNMFFIFKNFWYHPKSREHSLTPMSFVDPEII